MKIYLFKCFFYLVLCSIINIECRNAQNRFDKPILSVFVNSNECHLNSLDIHCNGYSQIFFENLLPNRRFGVEIVVKDTISTNYNHYSTVYGISQGQKYIDDFRPTCEFKVQIRLKKLLVSRILCRYGRSK